MKRILYVKIEIDWEDTDDISDELLFDDFCDATGLFPSETKISLVGSDKGIDYNEFKSFFE